MTTRKSPMTAESLTLSLMEVFKKVESGELDVTAANSLSKLANSTVNVIKTQILYNKQVDSKKKIKFLEC